MPKLISATLVGEVYCAALLQLEMKRCADVAGLTSECSSKSSAERPTDHTAVKKSKVDRTAGDATQIEIPDDIWAACFRCAVGFLCDGTEAKMPLASSLIISMNDHQFCHPRKWITRVMALLKYFECFPVHVALDFHNILRNQLERTDSILSTDISVVPGLYRPESGEFSNIEIEEPHAMGDRVVRPWLKAAEDYALKMWNRSFDTLDINGAALAICLAHPPNE